MRNARIILEILRQKFFAILLKLKITENTFLMVLAVIIGLLAGLCHFAFRKSILFFDWLIVQNGSHLTGYSPHAADVSRLWGALFPISGALLMLPLFIFFRKDLSFGFPRFLETVNLRGGKLKGRQIVTRGIASALTIGSGSSAGQEGPIAQIGGSVGSLVGQALGMSTDRLKVLIGCGVSGGIAATFNAPLAGVFFAHEIVLLSSFELSAFTSIVISSGIATIVSRSLFGDTPAFAVPPYTINHPLELLFYALLGIFLGFLGVFFISTYTWFRGWFGRLNIHPLGVPILGGILMGIVAVLLPDVSGNGYHFIEVVVADRSFWLLLTLLILGKIIATSITVGSGLPGGLFAPSLFIGAVAGGSFGHLMKYLFPNVSGMPGAYALVGMGAFLSAVVHAPMTGIFLLFEMTSSYQIIVPIMICCVIGTAIARHFHRESIDTVDLVARGINIKTERDERIMKEITVGEAMNRQPTLLPETMTLREFSSFLASSRHTRFPLVDGRGDLTGIVSELDFLGELGNSPETTELKDLATRQVVTVTEEETLSEAFDKMSYRNIDLLPVVEKDSPRRIVGTISRRDILSSYNRCIMRTAISNK